MIARSRRCQAVYLFDSAKAAEQPLHSPARELIDKNREVVGALDLEVTVSVAAQLARLGLALER